MGPFSRDYSSKNVCVNNFHIMNIDVPAGVGAPPLDTQLQATCMDVLSPNSWRVVVHIQSVLLYALKASVTADCDISHYLLACFIPSSLCRNLRIESLIACKGTTTCRNPGVKGFAAY